MKLGKLIITFLAITTAFITFTSYDEPAHSSHTEDEPRLISHLGDTLLGDTVISLSELELLMADSKQLSECQNIMSDKNLQLYTFKEVIQRQKSEINSLEYRYAKLQKAVLEHNNKLKKSQSKYRIETN